MGHFLKSQLGNQLVNTVHKKSILDGFRLERDVLLSTVLAIHACMQQGAQQPSINENSYTIIAKAFKDEIYK